MISFVTDTMGTKAIESLVGERFHIAKGIGRFGTAVPILLPSSSALRKYAGCVHLSMELCDHPDHPIFACSIVRLVPQSQAGSSGFSSCTKAEHASLPCALEAKVPSIDSIVPWPDQTRRNSVRIFEKHSSIHLHLAPSRALAISHHPWPQRSSRVS